MSKTTITLELTEFEAEALQSILMHGVSWALSGALGEAAGDIYDALGEAGVTESNFVPKKPRHGGVMVWGEAEARS